MPEASSAGGVARYMVMSAETYLFSQEDEDVRVEISNDLAAQVPLWFEKGVDPQELAITLAETAAHLAHLLSDVTGRPVFEVVKGAADGARDMPSAAQVDPAGLTPGSRRALNRRGLHGTTGYREDQ